MTISGTGRAVSAAFFLAASAILFSPAARADSSIAVLVNDKPITTFEVNQRARFNQVAHTGGATTTKGATEELIDELLEISEAALHGITVSDDRVNAAITQITHDHQMTPAQLAKGLGGLGVGMDTLKQSIRAKIAWGQVVQSKVRSQVTVKGSDVMQALSSAGNPDKLTTTEFTLQQIIFVVPKTAPAAYQAQRRREAESYRLRFSGCDSSIDQAKSLKDVTIRTMGRRTSNELSGNDGKEVQSTPAGKTTSPHQTDQGFELIAVCSTRVFNSNAGAVSATEMKLTLEQSKNVDKDYLKQIRDKAVIVYR